MRTAATPNCQPKSANTRTEHLRSLRAMVILVALLLISSSMAMAARGAIFTTAGGDVPTTGGMRPGPVGLNPPPLLRTRGVMPLAITIPNAAVDAEVEIVQIVDGVMQNPTGPWVVSWYEQTAKPGAGGNAVMSGHVDYWDVGPAVLYNLRNLVEGDEMFVTAADGTRITYQLQWMRTYEMATITAEQIEEIVGPTDSEALTLITCGGEFNYETGEYLSRTVARAVAVDIQGPSSTGGSLADVDQEPSVSEADQQETADEVVAVGLAEGGFADVVESEVNLRAAASIDAEIVTVLTAGTELAITGPAEEVDGRIWWPVEDPSGNQGYVVEDYLRAVE